MVSEKEQGEALGALNGIKVCLINAPMFELCCEKYLWSMYCAYKRLEVT